MEEGLRTRPMHLRGLELPPPSCPKRPSLPEAALVEVASRWKVNLQCVTSGILGLTPLGAMFRSTQLLGEGSSGVSLCLYP